LIIIVIAGAVAIISRPFSTYVKFVYPNAKFEAMGNPYITDNILTTIVDSKNLDDFKDSVNSSKNYKIEGETTSDIQESLDKAFLQIIEMMKKDSSNKMANFYHTYLEKMDMYLIKNELKNKLLGITSKEETSNRAILPETKELLQKISDADKEKLPDIVKTYGFSEDIQQSLRGDSSGFLSLDSSIDRYVINKLVEVDVPYKCNPGLQKFVKTFIDIRNIKNVLRAKQLEYDKQSCMKLFIGDGHELASWKYQELSDVDSVSQVITNLEGTSYYDSLKNSIERYNTEKSVQVLENALDCYFLKIIRDISTQNFVTIGPTIRFITSSEFEIKNLKTIAKGVGEHLPAEIIKQFLITEVN
jgi:vacuolar-type H+-ATPase subunit C/Vma6